jgi:hypothetical protein
MIHMYYEIDVNNLVVEELHISNIILLHMHA